MIGRSFLLGALLSAPPVQAAEVWFCWIGSAGYRLEGYMTFPDALADAALVTEAEVTGFAMIGFLHDEPVGHWSMDQLGPGTSWNLNYAPREMRFPTGGWSSDDNGQQWNAGGDATDCGDPGLGFNSGAGAQDLCVDGRFVQESGVAPDTILMAYATSEERDQVCRAPAQLSFLTFDRQTFAW
jgi:hypothetical protein